MIFFLTGYMACGKTTLGRAMADASLARFVDLDEFLEKKSGLSPAEWFARRGEDAFRAAELDALRELCLAEDDSAELPLIIACGGGTPCQPAAADLMDRYGTVVWLEASMERTIARLLDAPGKRPLVDGMDKDDLRRFVEKHISQRRHAYQRAHIRFDSTYLDNPEEIARTVGLFARIITR